MARALGVPEEYPKNYCSHFSLWPCHCVRRSERVNSSPQSSSGGLAAFSGLVSAENERWFSEKVQPHELALRHWLRGRYPQIGDVDDIVQETYARVFRARASSDIVDVRPYLFTVARNAAFDIFRKKRRHPTDSINEMKDFDVVEDSPHVLEKLAREYELATLREAISALPDRCREVFTLRKLYGLHHREIAQRLGITEKTVMVQVSVGLVRCRKYLLARGIPQESMERAKFRPREGNSS